eukprot:TRINITY_DN1993_c1_g7_i1.p1 TRINITY_DN1993_c1_g7~~TRINITY_DN1993_c1_g7_i1.p1  ORF type:complete len:1641 (-),score=350.73 TRINITY_DN1993_c1_g7_i1:284-5206(-)
MSDAPVSPPAVASTAPPGEQAAMSDAPASPPAVASTAPPREQAEAGEPTAKRPRLASGEEGDRGARSPQGDGIARVEGADDAEDRPAAPVGPPAPPNPPGIEPEDATRILGPDTQEDTLGEEEEEREDDEDEDEEEEEDDDDAMDVVGNIVGPQPLSQLRSGCQGGRTSLRRVRSRLQPRRRQQPNGLGSERGAAPDLGRASSNGASSGSLEASSSSQWTWDKLPPPRENELEFFLKDPRSYRQGKSVLSPILSLQGGAFRFRLLLFPMGTETTQKPEQLAAFVEAVPPEDSQAARWVYEGVKYQISIVNWKDYRRTVTQADTYTFRWDSADRGWHRGFLRAVDMTAEDGWLGEDGQLCLRASCCARRALLHMPAAGHLVGAGRRAVGYVGLKNHGATCYMNCLLQTLFHIGRFRETVYSIDGTEPRGASQESMGSQAPALSDEEGADAGGLGDERPALPLLVALQNLFYRLQTSDVPVSCRELMRSFGWDTADAFMQHDAQELNRLLCDRLEEQMKGTAMDGAIKRLFEGEMENYIDCMDVDYRSVRSETFYDLQLNVRNDAGEDLTTLEASLRNFTSEEILEGDNAYDAGAHGKQRARKGIKFKRFPPVLYIQLKRFMFDAERMDMCKINGRLDFPLTLDLEALAPGSGTYNLHTVVVHSGGVSSGHYYAFVRVRDGENGASRWVKFDDDLVTSCSEQAAVEDNYGGEDPVIWNYFHLSPRQLAERSVPTAQRIHNAYMLSYVRSNMLDEVLSPPNLDEGKDAYRRLAERCLREAQLAEERRRARVEQLLRVEVRLLLERDLMKLESFWSHHALPWSHRLRMSREQLAEDLWREAESRLDVPSNQMALFLLHIRKTRQVRFKYLPPHQALRIHLPPHGAPHSNTCEPPHLVVLCVAARGYDPRTLAWQLNEPPRESLRWNDEVCLLIVKYFCTITYRLVTLGCYYCNAQDTLDCMLAGEESWLEQRLQPFVDRKDVVALPAGTCNADGSLLCWEEYCHKNPKDICERDPRGSIEKEGLFNGDVIVWQLAPARNRRVQDNTASRDEAAVADADMGEQQPSARDTEDTDGGADASDSEDAFQILTVKDLAVSLMSQVPVSVQLHRPDAPMCPDNVLADGVWGDRAVATCAPPPLNAENEAPEANGAGDARRPVDDAAGVAAAGGEASPSPRRTLGEVEPLELVADCRWRAGNFAAKLAKAFQAIDAIRSGREELWLFAHGPPSSADEPPCVILDAAAFAGEPRDSHLDRHLWRSWRLIRGVDRKAQLCQLLPRFVAMAASKMLFHAVMLPLQPRRRPVVVHFFSAAVVEVGAVVLHLPNADGDSDSRGAERAARPADEAEEDDENGDASLSYGRPALDAREVLELARRHLDLPCHAELRAQLLPRPGQKAAGDLSDPAARLPLRLVDVTRGRLSAVFRCREATAAAEDQKSAGDVSDRADGPALEERPAWSWPARGINLFACALRVEPDWDYDPPAPAVADGSGDSSKELPAEHHVGANGAGSDAMWPSPAAPAQMAEVFHCDGSQQQAIAFGHPFLLRVARGETARSVALRIQAKLGVPDADLRLVRLLAVDGDLRSVLDEADEWPIGRSSLPATAQAGWSPSALALCLERPHPARQSRSRSPTNGRQLRHRPLTIASR